MEIQCIAMATIMDEYLHLGKYRNAFSADPEGPGPAAFFLTGISIIAILVTLPLSLCLCIKVIVPSSLSLTAIFVFFSIRVIIVFVINIGDMVIINHHNHGFQVVQEYERAVIFRLGRLRKGGAKVGTTSSIWTNVPNT